jgi:transcriptional regulator with XRE-family HTH domain
MMEGEWINVQWIRDRLHSSGRTQRELAKELGVDASQISRLLEGSRRLKADEIPIIRRFFEDAPRDDHASGGPQGPAEEVRTRGSWKRGGRPAADIPVFLLQPAGRFFKEPDRATEHRATLPQLSKVAGAFAMIIPDARLEPRFAAGEVVYIHPNRPVIPGAFVVGRYRDRSGTVVIGRIIDVRSDLLQLKCKNLCREAYRPDEQFSRDDFGQLGTIVAVEMN